MFSVWHGLCITSQRQRPSRSFLLLLTNLSDVAFR